jgi:hypothetical protein
LVNAELEIEGTGSVQRPFTITNPTYNKQLQVERQALGMGLLWKDNNGTVSSINSQNRVLNINAGSNLIINTGLAGEIQMNGDTKITEQLEIEGSGSIQRPFIIANPTYGKSLEIEREQQGMGIVFMDGATSTSRINTINNNLGISAVGDISFSTGLLNKVDLGLKASCNNFEIDGTIQRPFIIQNPTYNKSLEIEREQQGMGVVFLDGATSTARINTVNNDLGITSVGNVNISTGLTSTVTGLPLVNSFACSDETTPINTTGIKTSIRIAQDIQLSKIKISLNVQSGGLGIILRKNGIQFAAIPMGTNFFVNATNSTVLVEDDLVTVEVNFIATSTGTGLKCYLIGTTLEKITFTFRREYATKRTRLTFRQ